MVEVV